MSDHERGERGPRGDAGSSGAPGPRGERGPRGDSARERYRLEAAADYLGIAALWSVVMFAGAGDAVNLGCVGGIASIAGVAGWMKHKNIPGGAIVLMATWPLAKLLAMAGGAGWRHFG